MSATLIFSGEKEVHISGIDMGGLGTVISQNPRAIAVKWPAGTHWVGNGMPRGYHSPETEVMFIIEEINIRGTKALKVDRLIAWENKRNKNEK